MVNTFDPERAEVNRLLSTAAAALRAAGADLQRAAEESHKAGAIGDEAKAFVVNAADSFENIALLLTRYA
jgi:hypothetical protein